MMNSLYLPQSHRRPLYSRLTIVGLLSGLSLLAGLAPTISHQSPLEFNAAAVAQNAKDPIDKYARAAYEIERRRQQDYAEAKRIMGGNVPGDVCRQQDIPAPVRDICNRFLSSSSDIIKKNGLTIPQFNDITRRKDADPTLKQQIQGELLRLQKTAP